MTGPEWRGRLRFAACILLVLALVTVAAAAGAAHHAVLPPAAALFGPSIAFRLLAAYDPVSPPGLVLLRSLPPRAPPLP